MYGTSSKAAGRGVRVAVMAAVMAAVVLGAARAVPAREAGAKWPAVPAVDLSKFKAADFADDELDVPYMLQHFGRVVGSVVEEGPDRGFLNIAVNRDPKDNKPYNARILEMNVAVSYFYTTKRPWNPYYADAGVRARLEAMLDLWCRKQQPETGFFAEYGPDNFSLAPTGFGAQSMSRTLERLSAADAPPFDKEILERTFAAERAAIMGLLTRDEPYKWGRDWSNQWSGVYRAALAYMKLRPDEEMARALLAGARRSSREFQSPTGFLYEQGGPDFGYSGVHVNNIRLALPLLREDAGLMAVVKEEEGRWAKWLSYNLVRQPGTNVYFANAGVNTRTSFAVQTPGARPVGEFVEGVRAFGETADERAAGVRAKREKLEKGWPKVPEMTVPSAYSYNPGTLFFPSSGYGEWVPTVAEREASAGAFPYVKARTFAAMAHDPRENYTFLYVRRPGYYAILNAGKVRVPGRDMKGLGLLWHEAGGVFVQSVAGTEWTWGTRRDGEKDVAEKKGATAQTRVGGAVVQTQSGFQDLAGGTVVTTYSAGADVKKTVRFEADAITVEVEAAGAFTEMIPLVQRTGDEVAVTAGKVTVKRGGTTLTIEFDSGVKAEVGAGVPLTKEGGGFTRAMVTLGGKERLRYTMRFGG